MPRLSQSQSAPSVTNRGKYRATRAKNILQPYGERSKLNIFCPKCAKMGTVSDVLSAQCCKNKEPVQKICQANPGEGERRKRRDDELLAEEVFFPKIRAPK